MSTSVLPRMMFVALMSIWLMARAGLADEASLPVATIDGSGPGWRRWGATTS